MKNRILVVEDSKTINNILKVELEKLNYDIDQAFTFEKAKYLIENNDYKLIVLDLHLPDGEGYELIDNIKSLTNTKVVVLTSSVEQQLRENLFQYGILDYIIKDKNILYSINEIHKSIKSIEKKTNGNILVIDDSKFICKQIATVLKPRNYNVDSVYNGQDGLDSLEENKFDLIILDMELPDMHGLDVLDKIRKNKKYINLPILILSGTSNPDIVRKVLKGGGNDFLKKPFIIEEFVLKIDLWINNNKKDKIIENQAKDLKEMNNSLEYKIKEEVEKNKQQQLLMLHQSRLAQMGEMISMIAHQWRQPLNSLSMLNQSIILKSSKDKLDKKFLEYFNKNSKKQIQNMSKTIDDFRDFFKPEKQKVEFCVNDVISDTIDMIKPIFSIDQIDILFYVQEEIKILGYPNELGQAILNIINNSKDALLDNNICDKLKSTSCHNNKKIDISLKKDDANIILTIRDNAGGINSEIIKKIFDPYFSTKVEKNGTGLGLYMTKLIIEDHMGGKLTVSNNNDGAVFIIKI